MKTKTIRISVFLAAVVVLCVAGTKISRMTQTTTVQGDSLFLVVTGSVTDGTLQTRSIEATNLISALTNLPNWPISGSSGSATNVDVRTNANQFGAAGVTLTLKDGFQTTNGVQRGFTISQTNLLNSAILTNRLTVSGLASIEELSVEGVSTNNDVAYFNDGIVQSGIQSAGLGSVTAVRYLHAGVTAGRAAVYESGVGFTNSAVTSAELGYLSGVTGAIQTQMSNQVRVASGTGGITVTPSGSGGIMTYTISDDDAGGSALTNYNNLNSGRMIVTNGLNLHNVTASALLMADAQKIVTNVTIGTGLTLTGTSLAADVSAAATFDTDNLVIRSDGAGRAIQKSLVKLEDDGSMQSVSNFQANDGRFRSLYVTNGIIGGGGTNYPPVIRNTTAGVPAIALGSGVRQHVTVATNASFAVNFTGTALNGDTVRFGVSNYNTAAITLTNWQAGSAANVYQPRIGGLASTFTIGPTSISTFEFVWHTNFNLGTVRQELQWDSGYEYRLAAGATTYLGTNAGTVFVEVKTNQTFASVGASGITNAGTLTQSGVSTFTELVHVDNERIMASVGVNTAELIVTNTATGPRFNVGQIDVRTNLHVATAIVTNSLTAPLLTAGQVDVRTNLYADTITVTNSLTVGSTNVVSALAGKQAASMVLSNLVGTVANNATNAGWGISIVNGTAALTNRQASIATNATSVTVGFSDTENIQILNAWWHLTTNLVVSPTNLVVGRTMAVYFDTNSLTYDVTITNSAATPVRWNFNVSTNGSTSFTKTNTLRARVFLTAETNGIITAEMGYYR